MQENINEEGASTKTAHGRLAVGDWSICENPALMLILRVSYDITESNMYRGLLWIEDILIKDETFSLPGRKAWLKSDAEHEAILVDATETSIERPQKTKKYYPRKKKRHTLKCVVNKFAVSAVKNNESYKSNVELCQKIKKVF